MAPDALNPPKQEVKDDPSQVSNAEENHAHVAPESTTDQQRSMDQDGSGIEREQGDDLPNASMEPMPSGSAVDGDAADAPSQQEVPNQVQAQPNEEDHEEDGEDEGGEDEGGEDEGGEDEGGEDEAEANGSEGGPPAQHDEPERFEPEAEEDIGEGSEFKRMPKLMKQMLFQFDRSLGFKGFSTFCDEVTDNLRTEISKPSRQSFARTFTKARRKVPSVMELELARTCHGGYIPDNAKKFLKDLPRFQKWVDEEIPVVDGRPQPKTKDPSGTQKAPMENAKKTGEAAVKGQSGTKLSASKSKKKRSYGVANAGCSKEARRNKKHKKDDDDDQDPPVDPLMKVWNEKELADMV